MKIKKIDAQPTEIKKLRVAAYCRVSTESDDQRESLEAQKSHYESWIKLHNNWENAGIFYDFGISGTKADSRDRRSFLSLSVFTGSVQTPAEGFAYGYFFAIYLIPDLTKFFKMPKALKKRLLSNPRIRKALVIKSLHTQST